MSSSPTHLVLIPSYNTGPRLERTVVEALGHWSPVWVVVDGSTDGSARALQRIAADDPRLRVLMLRRNTGKGGAVAAALADALAAGFTHVLVMDSDGQHSAAHIAPFMAASLAEPKALVLGRPVFGPEVPLVRLYGRKFSNGLVHFETLGRDIDDSLFGFRVYPAAPLRDALESTSHARGFDFDPEVAVRMYWAGVPMINLPAPCRYISKADGGISHFRYLHDNLKMVRLHVRLLAQLAIWRWVEIMRVRRAAAVSRRSARRGARSFS